jgi:radical SAM superfamily enzyme YgiQ (UPF0313 family)
MTRPLEEGAVHKPWGSAIPVALVFPNAYGVGMGNLGFQFLYDLINSHPRFLAERFFFPDRTGKEREWDKPPLSEESGRPLANFSVIAFSVPFENDYPAVPAALVAAGIPPLQADRGPMHPLVIAGGVSVSMNPEPLAPFLDLAFIGEMDDEQKEAGFLSALAEMVSGTSRRGPERKDLLRELRDIPGVYVPGAYTFELGRNGHITDIIPEEGFPRRVKAVKRRSSDSPVPTSVLFTPDAEFGESLLVETNRGCSRGCRFCAAGWIHHPVRYAKLSRFRDRVEATIAQGRTVGLIGSDLARHPELEEILEHIVHKGGTFSLSSIRPEGLTPNIIRLVAATGQKTATLAPETASPRMKAVIGKPIASERFYELVEHLVTAGIPNIRFYFMLGLPSEADEDAEAIVEFVSGAREIFVDASRPRGRIGRIGVQINPFVPKPWTPFQWAAMALPKVLERRLRIVETGLKKKPNVVVRVESVRTATTQAFLSRGDRRIAAAIARAAGRQGRWPGVCKKEGIDPAFYVHRERELDEIFPWDVTDHGVAPSILKRIFLKSMACGRIDPPETASNDIETG